MSIHSAYSDVGVLIITSRRRLWRLYMTLMYGRVPAASTGWPTVREATSHAVLRVPQDPRKRTPAAGLLPIRSGRCAFASVYGNGTRPRRP